MVTSLRSIERSFTGPAHRPQAYSQGTDGERCPWGRRGSRHDGFRSPEVRPPIIRQDGFRIDFNGYWGGNLTVIVPTGWSANIEFINGSQSFRHSLMVTRVYAPSEMPVRLEAKGAIWGADTDPPEGMATQERAQLSFVAQQSGRYFLACARQTHLMDGHWIGFEVRDGVEQAMVVHEDRFPPEQPPGRP